MKIHDGGFFSPLLKLSVDAKSENFGTSKREEKALLHILSKVLCVEAPDRPF